MSQKGGARVYIQAEADSHIADSILSVGVLLPKQITVCGRPHPQYGLFSTTSMGSLARIEPLVILLHTAQYFLEYTTELW